MDIETSEAIKVFFPKTALPLIYFEAIANALDANADEISIEIELSSFDAPESLKIEISDNGDGFNEENYARFRTLLKPRDRFHKGIGRLVYLSYFKEVKIESSWGSNSRSFTFKEGFNADNSTVERVKESKNRTSLSFSGFKKGKINSYDNVKPAALKTAILEQFLPTLEQRKRDGKRFEIKLALKTDESNNQKQFFDDTLIIDVNDLPILTTIKIDNLDVFSDVVLRYHIKKSDLKSSCLTAFSIDGRTIPVNLISSSKIPVGYNCLFLIESEIFHSHADSSRQRLILPEGLNEQNLYRRLKQAIGRVLSEEIPEIEKQNADIERSFEKHFPHLLGYFESETIGLIDRDEALSVAQQKFFIAEKEILQCENLTESGYKKSLELSSRVLTEYVLYREKIIKRLSKINKDNSEAEIHNLIVPRYQEFQHDSQDDIYQNNAWLLDDKFMTFRTILSEKRMDQVIQAISLESEVTDNGRPDIAMIFSADPDRHEAVDAVIVEIKKKTDDEKENQFAINQLLKRARKITQHCRNIQRIWYYAVIEINEDMAESLIQQKWAPLFSKGRTFYQDFVTRNPEGKEVPTPTYILSFDAIVKDAASRNHVFLDILRKSMKRYNKKKH